MPKIHISGFSQYDIDAVIKIGGSILSNTENAAALMHTLGTASREGYRLLLVPGGGPPDKAIEAVYQQRNFTMSTAHRACALAQDQVGLILSDPLYSENIETCSTFGEVRNILDTGRSAMILPSNILFAMNPVEATWDITSDAIAGWFAWITGTKRLAILTDVDGIYTHNPKREGAELIASMQASEVVKMGQTSIDLCLARWIEAGMVSECVIINGSFPDRLRKWLDKETFLGTVVTSL